MGELHEHWLIEHDTLHSVNAIERIRLQARHANLSGTSLHAEQRDEEKWHGFP